MRPFLLVFLVLLLAGCFTTDVARRVASPQTGCREEQLEIENLNEAKATWEAVGCGGRWLCGPTGREFRCSAAVTPQLPPPIPAEPAPAPRRVANADERSRKTVAAETGCALDSLRVTQHLEDGDTTLTRVEGCGPAWMCMVAAGATCRIAQGQTATAIAPETRSAPAPEPVNAGPPRKPASH